MSSEQSRRRGPRSSGLSAETGADSSVRVDSEVGRLERVLLHRPGAELEKLTPEYLGDLLFDDIPWLAKIREEHDAFAETLRSHGAEVLYYEDLLGETVADESVRGRIIDEVMSGCRIGEGELRENLRAMLAGLSPEDLAADLISGVTKREYRRRVGEDAHGARLSDYIEETYPFYLDPLPNLYFTRDPGTVIGSGISINTMKTPARMRESLLLDYIFSYHPLFGSSSRRYWYSRGDIDPLEGGDILVLSTEVVAVGCSDRTSTEAIERLSGRLLADGYREVLVIRLPFTRAFMHLDTVFTMVDRDAFTIFPGIKDRLEIYRLSRAAGGGSRDEDDLHEVSDLHEEKGPALYVEPIDSLQRALKESLQLSAVRLIESGGGDFITAAREQWNDSTNTLALSPGVVVTYDRNAASNTTLRRNGVEVVEIEGSELVRGRGGPRCMSMPLKRRPLE